VRAPRERAFRAFTRGFDEAGYLARLREAGVRWIGRSELEYPPLLHAIHDPPAGLFVRGDANLAMLRGATVAVVGARSCSPYGAQVARMLGRELAGVGLVVVSGLARGVDGEAHRGALEAGGATIAVLGCGVDRDYPAAHAELAARIRATGVTVSEYAPGVEPAPWRFPARNRIIAGLSAATVVVEARERSGALITADLALEEGREVFAVPGEITSALSSGTNDLLKLGASPLTSPADVLDLFGLTGAEAESLELGSSAETVLARLRDGPASADELARATGLEAGTLASALTELELAGCAVAGGGVYRAN
jgi:DNA processing protein